MRRGGERGSSRSTNLTTTKLHVAGVGMNPDTEKVREMFEEYGTVREVHPMSGRDVCFVHIDEKAAELAMVGLSGKLYNGEKLKVEYGTLSKKPNYDKRAPKVNWVEWLLKGFVLRDQTHK